MLNFMHFQAINYDMVEYNTRADEEDFQENNLLGLDLSIFCHGGLL